MNFNLLVVTPYSKKFNGQVESLNLKTSSGEITIYAGHDSLIGEVVVCKATLVLGGAIKNYICGSGILRITNNSNSVELVVNDFIPVEEVSIEKALQEKREAEELLKNAKSKREQEFAEYKLKRALVEINVKNNNID